MTIILAGRSSSHFTRVTRMFAHALEVDYRFEPIADLSSQDIANYCGNPALKMPILVTPDARWFGSANICRELARRAARPYRIAWPEDASDSLTCNAFELTQQGMATEVTLIMAGATGDASETGVVSKPRASLMQSLAWLDANLDGVLERLPPARELSLFEVMLYCFVSHLPFRKVLTLDAYPRLTAFCDDYGRRPEAECTAYHFDGANAGAGREAKPKGP